MAIPKQVRQRMINVMYIVLLALLALQIPKEVTEAFLRINEGIEDSSVALGSITMKNIAAIEQKGANGDQLAVEYAVKSHDIHEATEDLTNFIEYLKKKIKTEVGVDENGKILSPEETTLTNEILVKGLENGINDGLAFELKSKISKGLQQMTDIFPRDKMDENNEGAFDQLVTSLPIYDLAYKEPDEQLWVMNTFDKMPAAGAIAMLSQIQSDIRTSESKLIEELKTLTGTGIPFDVFKAKIVAPSTYILRGDKFKADLFLSASSTQTDNIVITANGKTYRPGTDGMVNFEELANTVGQKSITGNIAITNTTTGKTETIPFENFTYTVSDPFANVSPTKMNVFYKGIDNPISASAAGVLSQDLTVSITNGSIRKENGEYLVNVSQLGDTKVIVKDKNGRTHGEFPFRVKRVPDPIAEVANKSGGNVYAAEFRVQKGLNPVMKDFVFDLRYKVISYEIVYIPKNDQPVVSSTDKASFSNTMKNHVERAKAGDRYAFENIKVKGPDGELRNLDPISFKIM